MSASWLGAACGSALVLFAVPCQAAVLFVSATGNDASACTRTQPCRSLQHAHNLAASGDEIQVLDSGEYGPELLITKSITVSAVGVTASLSSTSTVAISIGNPTARVVLRGLHLRGYAAGFGLYVGSAAAVHIENCEVERFVGQGLAFEDVDQEIFIKNSSIHDNGEEA